MEKIYIYDRQSFIEWKVRYDTFYKFCGDCIKLDKKLYPEVTFENSPMKVELKLL